MAAFLRYGLVGGGALVLHIAVLEALLLTGACEAWIASAIGFVIACGFNYTLQSMWVFRTGPGHAVALPRYIAITGAMLGINTILFSALFASGIPPVAAQVITTGCVFVLNFFSNLHFTFNAVHSPRA